MRRRNKNVSTFWGGQKPPRKLLGDLYFRASTCLKKLGLGGWNLQAVRCLNVNWKSPFHAEPRQSKAGTVNARMVLKASRLPLRSSARQIAKLEARLSKMAVERAHELMTTAKAAGTIAAGEGLMQEVTDLADYAQEKITSMTGCPNPGYSTNTQTNTDQKLVVPTDDWEFSATHHWHHD